MKQSHNLVIILSHFNCHQFLHSSGTKLHMNWHLNTCISERACWSEVIFTQISLLKHMLIRLETKRKDITMCQHRCFRWQQVMTQKHKNSYHRRPKGKQAYDSHLSMNGASFTREGQNTSILHPENVILPSHQRRARCVRFPLWTERFCSIQITTH